MEVPNNNAPWVVFLTQSKNHNRENVEGIENHPKVVPWENFKTQYCN